MYFVAVKIKNCPVLKLFVFFNIDVVCESLRNPPNGIVTITRIDSSTNKVLPGSQAVYSCNGGFEISGNGVRDCQPDGTWSGSEPTCRVPG